MNGCRMTMRAAWHCGSVAPIRADAALQGCAAFRMALLAPLLGAAPVKALPIWRGTGSSNLSPSSGESLANLIDVSTPVIAGQLLSSRGEKTAARGNCRATSVAARSSPDPMKAAVRLPAPPTRSRAPRRPAPRDIGTITAPATRPASLQGRAEGASAYAPGAIPPGSRLRPDWPVSLDLRHFADNRRPGGLYGADDGDRFRGYITRAPS